MQFAKAWSIPITFVQRSGFEITAYQMIHNIRALSTWSTPSAIVNRSGFEITGYQMARNSPAAN